MEEGLGNAGKLLEAIFSLRDFLTQVSFKCGKSSTHLYFFF
jgi:hypothetical protein